MLTLFEKRVLGSLYGGASPRADIPRLLGLYREGKLPLDEMLTSEYELADINTTYDDMLAGLNIRDVVVHCQLQRKRKAMPDNETAVTAARTDYDMLFIGHWVAPSSPDVMLDVCSAGHA